MEDFSNLSFSLYLASRQPYFELFYVILPLKQHNNNVNFIPHTVYKAATNASRRKARGRKTQRTFIGLPKETSHQERRICSTDAVNSLTCHGHRVMIECAGESSSYSDKEYSDAGAVTKGY
jgi:hypothetical protein